VEVGGSSLLGGDGGQDLPLAVDHSHNTYISKLDWCMPMDLWRGSR
jgi:hypothetical protein